MSDGMERLATGEYARAVESKQADAFRLRSRPTDQQVDEANWLIDRMSSRIEELEAKLAQQDDLVQAAVAAALIEVHDAIADYPLVAPDEMEAQHYDEQIGHCQSIILNRITENAYAALDRALAAERERCINLAATWSKDAAAAIRKGGE